MKISPREMMLVWITGLVGIAGLTFFLVEPQVTEWNVLAKKKESLTRDVEKQKKLIAMAPKFDAELTKLKKKLPTYPPGKDVSTDLQILIERLAKANEINLPSREAEKETVKANMYEVAINCKWEGKLAALTHFLFDLQKEDGILDISQLTITPNEKLLLRGGFTVQCSYSRAPQGGTENK